MTTGSQASLPSLARGELKLLLPKDGLIASFGILMGKTRFGGHDNEEEEQQFVQVSPFSGSSLIESCILFVSSHFHCIACATSLPLTACVAWLFDDKSVARLFMITLVSPFVS